MDGKKTTSRIIRLSKVFSPLLGIAIAAAARAQTAVNITNVTQVQNLAISIFDWLLGIFWTFASIMILYAGYLYLTAKGNAETVSKANKQLVYAAVAIVVGLIAWGGPKLVENLLKTGIQ